LKFSFTDGTEKAVWPDACGYLTCKVNGRNKKVHRLVYEMEVGAIPEGLTINHKDGNKLNNHSSNLEIMTFSENAKHAWRTGLARPCKGEAHGRSVLDEMQVLTIITMPKNPKNGRGNGWKNSELSEHFGVSQTRINAIRNGREWRHVHALLKD